ncbi:MAG TPA: 23S rRNA (pseudouridine(1915)-N(3))-methyltransferase RlmH [Bacteroidales bacterium]|nr:23S rRNA (pseudouridine(1915)-N(3))-methyltransferase RlmH [Bacteroidales bacterium]
MKLVIIQVGKTDRGFLSDGLTRYYSRIKKMIGLEVITIGTGRVASMPAKSVLKDEGEKITERLKPGDYVIALDEKGEQMSSRELASFMREKMNRAPGRIVFIIGGAWGLDAELKRRSDKIISLSPMTFPHQLVRLLFSEQLYRAMTIIKGIPYHHD